MSETADPTIACAVCGNPIPNERKPVEYDDDGLPIAMAVAEGYGVPQVSSPVDLAIFLDGEEQRGCVGFDRKRNIIWRSQVDPAGNFFLRAGEIAIEQVFGVVTVKALTPPAHKG